jgi:hypothetical protein
MTRPRRRVLRLVAVGAFALTIAGSVWLLVAIPGAKATDCATAQQMWTFYQSQMASELSAALESAGDNAGTAVKYQNMIDELQTYADRITTPDIRRLANRMVTINHDMFEQWKTWVAQSRALSSEPATPTSSDKQFGNQFAANARILKLVHAELTAACPH